MAQTALFMGPMARKKRVPIKYAPNSYRVISQQAEDTPFPRRAISIDRTASFNLIGQPKPVPDHRHNRPNPNSVGFLRQDVRLLNEPVCNVYTASTRTEQHRWWPSRISQEPLTMPPHTLDTTVRQDFQYRGKQLRGSARHTSNPNKQPSRGAVPVNFLFAVDGQPRAWKEGISYEHQYNSRADPSYPIRAKRHGSFVWDGVCKQDVDKMLATYGIKTQVLGSSARPEATTQKDVGRVTNVETKTQQVTEKAKSICQGQNEATKDISTGNNNPGPTRPVLPPVEN